MAIDKMNPSSLRPVERPTTPDTTGTGSNSATQSVAPSRDAAADAARLRGIAPQQGFRVGIMGRSPVGVSAAEARLPGGSIHAALGRAEEFGAKADAAAARVSANHPDIFGA